MNERLKELATEVGISVEYLTNTKQWTLIEALAELIIRECERVVCNNFDKFGGETEPWMSPGDLMKHFGVEE